MRFYNCATAPSPRRVRVFMAEKGIEVETVEVDLGAGEQFSEAFRRINPDCVVPVLQLDDGSCITEVIAICDYLESLHPEPALLGRNGAERAQVLMWNAKAEQLGLWAMADAFRNSVKGLSNNAVTGPESYAQIPELAERGRRRVVSFFHRLDSELSGRKYLAGDFYSMADITAMVVVDFAAWIKLAPPADAVHLRRWHADVSGRPSAAA